MDKQIEKEEKYTSKLKVKWKHLVNSLTLKSIHTKK